MKVDRPSSSVLRGDKFYFVTENFNQTVLNPSSQVSVPGTNWKDRVDMNDGTLIRDREGIVNPMV